MASKYWLKLFHETIYDPKVMIMSPGARLRFYECLCLAGDYDRDGDLPELKHMAFVFRIPENQLTEELGELVSAGIFDLNNDIYSIKKFGERQSKMDGKERVARYRQSKRNDEYEKQKQVSNDYVTNCYTDIDIDKDIDKEIESDPDPIVIVEKSKDKKPLKDEMKTNAAAALKTRMVSSATIKELLPDHPGEMILEYCKAYDEMKLQDPDKVNPGWLVKAIREGWQISGILKKAAARRPDPNTEQGRKAYISGKYSEFIEH